jgi:hypothetical protein
MIHLSVPVLAHASSPVPTSPNHWLHSSVLAITTESVTNQKAHNFVPQDKQIMSSLYSDILTATTSILLAFSTDPSAALRDLAELNKQLTSAIE